MQLNQMNPHIINDMLRDSHQWVTLGHLERTWGMVKHKYPMLDDENYHEWVLELTKHPSGLPDDLRQTIVQLLGKGVVFRYKDNQIEAKHPNYYFINNIQVDKDVYVNAQEILNW